MKYFQYILATGYIYTTTQIFLLENPLNHPKKLVFFLFFCFILFFSWILYNKKYKQKNSLKLIIITSIICQTIFLFMPAFFNDFFRYLWDGKMITNGINPFAYFPFAIQDSIKTAHLANIWYWDQLFFKWTHTIYGPTLQYIFALASYLKQDSAFVLKSIFLLFNLGSLFITHKLLKLLKLPTHNLIWLALHPLFIFETMASTHLEGIIIFLFLLTSYLYLSKKKILTGIAFAFLFVTKFFPLITFPFFLIKQKKWLSLVSSIFITTFLLYLPFTTNIKLDLLFTSLKSYGKNWVLSPGLYDLLFVFLKNNTKIITIIILSIIILITYFLFTKSTQKTILKIFPWNRNWKKETNFFSVQYVILLSLIILSASVFSWYLLWIIWLFPFIKQKATGVTLSITIIFQYLLIYFDNIEHNTYKYLQNGDVSWNQSLIWLPVLFVFIIEILLFYKKRKSI